MKSLEYFHLTPHTYTREIAIKTPKENIYYSILNYF